MLPVEASGSGKRSRTGCLACRRTRIKCDEIHPVCGRCASRASPCHWPETTGPSRQRNPKPRSSCESCRRRRIRCGGTQGQSCVPCIARGHECSWSTPQPEQQVASSATIINAYPLAPDTSVIPSWHNPTDTIGDNIADRPLGTMPIPPRPLSPSHPSEISNIKELIKLYFATVHHFGSLSFIHEPNYWELFEQAKAPEDLTLVMAASALRFGGQLDEESRLVVADRWMAKAGARVLSLVMEEFGALELMELVLCQTYDFLNGKYSRGFVMAGMAVRMMTFLRLHILDELPAPSFRPLLGAESLRRLAWAVWYLDATIDGGNFGFSAIVDGALSIQLPCDERPFLLHQPVATEKLLPSCDLRPSGLNLLSPVGLEGHLMRAMAARQILASLASKINRGLVDRSAIPSAVLEAEKQAHVYLDAFPPELAYSRAHLHAFREQSPCLIHVHVMRNTVRRHENQLRILTAPFLRGGEGNVAQERQRLIEGAKELSGILADALQYHLVLDPQIAMHAYNGIEVLLFQPMRLASVGHSGMAKEEILSMIEPLLQVIRVLAKPSELVALVLPEAINRMIQLGFIENLTNDDMMSVLWKVHSIATGHTEFDFNESFWRYEVSLTRRMRAVNVQGGTPNDILLELPPQVSPAPIPPPTDPVQPLRPAEPLVRLQTFFANALSRASSPTPGDPSMSSEQQGSTFSFLDDLQTMIDPQSAERVTTQVQLPFSENWWETSGSLTR